MSYVHCPACSRAYNLATQAACPCRPVSAPATRASEDIATAVESLARALACATPAERAAAAAALQRLGMPAPEPVWPVRTALAALPPRPLSKRRQLAAIAFSVVERIARQAIQHEPSLVRAGRRRVSSLLAR